MCYGFSDAYAAERDPYTLRMQYEACEDELRSAITSRDELENLFNSCVQYSNPEMAEELRVQMDQAMYACDEHIDESRRQLHRSEDELNEALYRLRQNW